MNHRRYIVMMLFLATFVAALLVTVTPVKAQHTWTVDDDGLDYALADFTHPQDAVNAANQGDIILVYPGTYGSRVFTTIPPHWGPNDQYAPALIVYKTDLTIKAVDSDPSKNVIESTHNFWSNPVAIQASTGGTWDGSQYVGAGVYPDFGTAPNAIAIIADNVTIEGFTIKARAHEFNSAPVMIGGLYAGDNGAPPSYSLGSDDAKIRNCIMTDSWTGVYIWHSSDNLLESNIVHNVDWRALQIFDGSTDAEVNLGFHSKNNQFIGNEIYNAWGGLFVGAWAPAVWPDNSGTAINDNYFHDLTDFAIGFGYTNSGGIAISGNNIENTKSGIISVGPVLLYDSLIDSNHIRLSDIGPWQSGIQLNRLDDVAISHNDIRNNENGWAIAIYHSKKVSLRCNDIINNAYGIAIVNSTDVEAHCNNIVGNGAGFAPWGPYPALYNSPGTGDPSQYIVDATNSWWGQPTGPKHSSNLGGYGDTVSDYVYFDPWLTSWACQPVGGEWAPMNALNLLVPLIALVSAVAAMTGSFVHVRRKIGF